MPCILSIESGSDVCSVALLANGKIYQQHSDTLQQHAQFILPLIEQLLAQSEQRLTDLDAIAVGRGPGSFTGIRLAISVAQGLGFGQNLPIIPISSLKALAWQALQEVNLTKPVMVLAAIDARMQEIYWSTYQGEGDALLPQTIEQVLAPAQLLPLSAQYRALPSIGVGTGWGQYAEKLSTHLQITPTYLLPEARPKASSIAALAAMRCDMQHFVAAEQLLPVYLRNEVAHKRSGK